MLHKRITVDFYIIHQQKKGIKIIHDFTVNLQFKYHKTHPIRTREKISRIPKNTKKL
jgi:hypothetical protein